HVGLFPHRCYRSLRTLRSGLSRAHRAPPARGLLPPSLRHRLPSAEGLLSAVVGSPSCSQEAAFAAGRAKESLVQREWWMEREWMEREPSVVQGGLRHRTWRCLSPPPPPSPSQMRG